MGFLGLCSKYVIVEISGEVFILFKRKFLGEPTIRIRSNILFHYLKGFVDTFGFCLKAFLSFGKMNCYYKPHFMK